MVKKNKQKQKGRKGGLATKKRRDVQDVEFNPAPSFFQRNK